MIRPTRRAKKGVPRGALLFWLAVWLCPSGPAAAAPATDTPTGTPAGVALALDGDTLVLDDGRHVRLIGVNTPELGKKGAPDEPLAQEAHAALVALIPRDKQVFLVRGKEPHDHYGRVLAHVFLADGRALQELLLQGGHGFLVVIPPNLQYLARYRRAEASARGQALGVWRHPYYVPVASSRLGKAQTGFRRVRGRIAKTWSSRNYFYFALSPKMAIMVPREHWGYFSGRPARLLDTEVVARGWVTVYRDTLRMRVGHPAMLEQVKTGNTF